MKCRLLVLIVLCSFCACTNREQKQIEPNKVPPAVKPVLFQSTTARSDRDLEKIMKWFEQLDAITREGLWVVKKERPPQGKTIFGKVQRALLVEMKQKLANKALFRCDNYTTTRKVDGIRGASQTAEIYHRCGSKENFVKIADWTTSNTNTLKVNFYGGQLDEVLGVAVGVLSPVITCEAKSTDGGAIEKLQCSGFMVDYDSKKNQVLKFSRFEYERTTDVILHLRGEVLENLDPVKKIEADVPIAGSILVTETVLQEPMVEAKPAIQTTPVASPSPKPSLPDDPNQPIMTEEKDHDPSNAQQDSPAI